jgi:hypothetical protein
MNILSHGNFKMTMGLTLVVMIQISQSQTNVNGSADENFQSRCTGPGVVKCLNLDNATGVSLQGSAKIDNAMKVSGSASMRVDIAPTAGDAPGNLTTKLGADFGEGSSLYIQWRQRFSPEMIDVDLGGEGFKQFVIYDGTPCGPNMEVAMLNQDYNGFPILYSACGNSYLRKSLGSGNYALMWDKDGTLCTSQNQSGCLRYQPDQWMTFYYEQKIGTWGQANSVVKVSMAAENQPLKTFIDFSDFTFKSDKATSAYRDIWIGPYSLGRTANTQYPAAQTWIDEVIISKQPIADPFQAVTPILEYSPGANQSGHAGGILWDASGSRISLSLSLSVPGQKVIFNIYDKSGKRVTSIKNLPGQIFEWDTSNIGSGLYLVEAIAGNRRFTQMLSVLN